MMPATSFYETEQEVGHRWAFIVESMDVVVGLLEQQGDNDEETTNCEILGDFESPKENE
jgi:hypothetical protein